VDERSLIVQGMKQADLLLKRGEFEKTVYEEICVAAKVYTDVTHTTYYF